MPRVAIIVRVRPSILLVATCAALGAGACSDDAAPVPADAGSPADTSVRDSGAQDSGSGDATAPAPCDLARPFESPTLVPGAVNQAGSADTGFWLLPDTLSAFVSSDRMVDGSAPGQHIFSGTRVVVDAPFETLTLATSLITGAGEQLPSLTADGKTIYFIDGTYPYHVWTATRASTVVDFDPPALVSAPINGTWAVSEAWISSDGSTLYLASDQATPGLYDIYRATRAGTGAFGTPTPVSSLNTAAAADAFVTLTADERQVFIGSDRATEGLYDIYYASRPTVSDEFSAPVALAELNTVDQFDYPLWVTPDGCTLYFGTSDRPGGLDGYHTYRATRGR